MRTAALIGRYALGIALLFTLTATDGLAALAQDPKAVQTAKSMKEKRATVVEIVTTLQRTHRLDAAGSARTLRAVDIDGVDAAPAIVRVYRATAATTASSLRNGGYSIDETARGLVRAGSFARRDVVNALEAAAFDPRDIQRVTIEVLRAPADEVVATMKAGGATTVEAATVLRDSYGLDALEGGSILLTAGFSVNTLAVAFRQVWMLDAIEAYESFEALDVSSSTIWWVLETAGYEMIRPEIHRYRIVDYRPGRSAYFIENEGIVDPSLITPIGPEPSDGVVDVLLGHRGLEDIEFRIGNRIGEIVGREPHTFTDGGETLPGEWVSVKFQDFESGSLTVQRLSASYSVPARALAYHLFDGELIAGPIRGMTVVLGAPQGEGSVTLPGGTYEGITVDGQTESFQVPAGNEAGIVSEVIDFASNDVKVDTRSIGDGTVELDIDISFETTGAEVQGTFLDYIPCWTCGTFEIPLSRCSGINVACFAGAIAGGIASLGTCTNPDNWVESKMSTGPALPFEADLTNPSLEIRILFEARNGAFAVKDLVSSFNAGVSLRTSNDNLSLGIIQGWVMNEVNARLVASLEQLDLGGRIVQALETGRTAFGWGSLRELWILDDGRWFLDASH